jgi:N6-adenosine-specific RNA methylase IME4
MKTDDIISLLKKDISPLIENDAHIYIWATNNFLKDGFKIMEALGFRYITCITWNKNSIGLGQYFRGKTEHCLFGIKGKLPYKIINGKRAQGVTGFYEDKRKHSQKPNEMRKMIEKVSYAPFLEVFARESFNGWDSYGNEKTCLYIINQIQDDKEQQQILN